MGYNPNMPRAVASAPRQLGGIDMKRLYTTQGIRNIMQRLKHMRAGITVRKLFLRCVDWLQMWAEISHCVVERPEQEIPPTSAKYFMSIREFLTRSKASIVMKERPKKRRKTDSFAT